jgi:hypothetical protein
LLSKNVEEEIKSEEISRYFKRLRGFGGVKSHCDGCGGDCDCDDDGNVTYGVKFYI